MAQPNLERLKTRGRAQGVILELGFQPNEHARHEDTIESPASEETMDKGTNIAPGEHITVTVGHEILSGTVDAVMPDNSYCWIWTDNGMGRRLIDTGDSPAGN